MKLSKNRFVVCLTLLLVLCLSLGVSVSLGVQSGTAQAESEQTVSLSGVQMRGHADGWYYYLVLQSPSYEGLATTLEDAGIPNGKTLVDGDKIKLYLSADDQGTNLSDLTIQHVEQNLWGTGGILINFAKYDTTHGGHQVYKVVVEEGCRIPYLAADGTTVGTYVVDKTYTFYNGSYGDESAKLGAYNWTGEASKSIALDGVQLRGVENDGWFKYLVLKSAYFNNFGKIENVEQNTFTSTLDKITLYTVNDEGKLVGNKMSTLDVKHIDSNFGYGSPWEYGSFIQFNKYDENNGSKVYKITVEKGCKIAVDMSATIKQYVTIDNDYTLYNGSFGNGDNAYGSYNWTATPTLGYRTEEKVQNITVGVWNGDPTGRVHFRTTEDGAEKYFVILAEAFNDNTKIMPLETSNFRTTLDKIKFYTVGDNGNLVESKLSDQGVIAVGRGQWGTPGAFFAFNNIDNFMGHKTYKVVLDEGLEILGRDEIVDEVRVKTIYRTTQAYTFYNSIWDANNAENVQSINWATAPVTPYRTEENITDITIGAWGDSINGRVQIRRNDDGSEKYLVLLSDAFEKRGENMAVETSDFRTTLDKIKLYTLGSDGKLVENKLSEQGVKAVGYGHWTTPGAFFVFDNFDNFAGHKTYKVVLDEGLEILVKDEMVGEIRQKTIFKTSQAYTFYNDGWDATNDETTFNAMNWSHNPTLGYRTEENVEDITVGVWNGDPTGRVHFRTTADGAEKYFVILAEAFNDNTKIMPIETSNFRTTLDKIKFYTVGSDGNLVESKLSDQGVTAVGRGQWGTPGAFFAFNNIDNFMGHKTYKVVLDEGLEILGKDEIVNEVRVKTVYRTTQAYTFYNSIWNATNTENVASTNWTTAPTIAYKSTEQTISLKGIQLRGDANLPDNSWYHYLVLQSDSYDIENGTLNSGLSVSDFSKVMLYVLDTNGQLIGKALSELGVNHIETNKWSEKGAFVAFDKFKDGYDGSKVYKVTIAAGTKVAYTAEEEAVVFVVDNDYTFYNSSYGNDENRFNALTSTTAPTIAYKSTEQTISLKGIQLRGDANLPDNSWYHYLVLQSDSYDRTSTMLNSGLSVSDFSKVMLYVLDENGQLIGKALSELGVSHIETNIWSDKGAFVAFNKFKDGYDGSKVYKITIAAGTKVAYTADEEAVVFVLDKDYTFYNMSVGNADNKFAAFDWVVDEPNKQTISLSGIQIRAMDETNAWYQYLVLQSTAFNGDKLESDIKSGIRFDKIKLYLDKNDETGVTLQQLGVTHVDRNMWGATGAFVNYGNYASYNGATVYKVVVEAGCQIPVYAKNADGLATVTIYVVDKDYVFYNVNYANDENKLGAFEWWNTPVPETVANSGDIDVVRVSNQSDGVSRWLILWFNEKFVGTTNVSFYETKGFANVLDNIYLYSGTDLSQTPIKLRDIFTGTITVGQFGSPDAIGFTVKNDVNINGSNNYLVVVKKGCEIPFIKDGVYSKRTVNSDTTFVNNDYGKTGEIPGSTGSDSRLYENFAIDWSKAVFVTYKTEGIQDVTFDKQCLVVGTKVDASKFAKEGYDVAITDSLGYTYYGVFYAPSSDVEVTLTYTEVKQPEPDNNEGGCNGVIAVGGAVSMIAALFAAAVVFKKKQK